ncbi:MerR family transcriptional regulator [Saccharibacillus sp. JS10]|uniref:MerR family transcriptional regulator n=1 Tax=Saccharibacillus sp. JS10 TaxID=2950552 RepID=UPI0021088843|nr:MerR family transcriptional regulator [Saccharibacillus sp. JS10]MCQ4088523.1 MerR family DNA-binding transcriptional regulator [Saccharibacillus sp. JS10]
MSKMTRGQLAKKTGLTAATIRFYEDAGVLPQPERSENGYRIYGEEYLTIIKFILDTKALGYPLARIGDTLRKLSGGSELSVENVRELVREQITEIEKQERYLAEVKQHLEDLLTQYDDKAVHEYMLSFRQDHKA